MPLTITEALRSIGAETGPGQIRCPFHGGGRESSPSARVYEDSVHCFTCHKSWTPASLLAERHGITMREAAAMAHRLAGDPVLSASYHRQALGDLVAEHLRVARHLPKRTERLQALLDADQFLIPAARGEDASRVVELARQWYTNLPGGRR